MGNRVTSPLIGMMVCAALCAAFLLSPSAASARGEDHPGLFAFMLIERINERLCERQKALAGRLPVQLIHPSKCFQEPLPEPEEPTVILTADPREITEGESVTLEWESTNAESCEASDGWNGSKALSGSEEVSPTETTTYHIDCFGPGGVAGDDVTVTVTSDEEPEEPTVDITADPMEITEGESSELSWSSENADSCTASNGWDGEKNVDGTETVSPTVTTTYAIECEGEGGTAQDSVTVTVNEDEPETGTLIVRKLVIRDDGSDVATSTFSFTVNDDDPIFFEEDEVELELEAGTYTVAEVEAEGFTTETDNCEAIELAAGEVETCTITNDDIESDPEAPTVDITASRTTVFEGSEGEATTTLMWESTNADSCMASNAWEDPIDTEGELEVMPTQTSTYAIECTGPGGTALDSVTVNFAPEDEPTPSEPNIVINEIAWMGSVVNGATSPDSEWIELRNVGDTPVDMADWVLTFATTSIAAADEIDLSACESTVVPADGFYLLVRNSIATTTLDADCVYPGGVATALANGGEIIELLDGAAEVVDSVDGSDNWEIDGEPQKGNNTTKETAQRADDGTWFTATPTPGEAN